MWIVYAYLGLAIAGIILFWIIVWLATGRVSMPTMPREESVNSMIDVTSHKHVCGGGEMLACSVELDDVNAACQTPAARTGGNDGRA